MSRPLISVRDIGPIVFGKRQGRFCMFAFYMDDSADAKRKTVFTVAGFVGDTSEWFEVERKWEKRVRSNGLDYFRTYDCKALEGEFAKLVDKYKLTNARVLANAMMKDLKDLIHASNLHAYCLGVLMEDYREAIKLDKAKGILIDDPYVAAHQQLIHSVAQDAHLAKNKPIVAFVYDEHAKAKVLSDDWGDFKKNNPTYAECMGTLMPLDDRTHPPLQVADLIANTITGLFVEHHKDPGAPEAVEKIKEWLPQIQKIAFWDRAYLEDLIEANQPQNRTDYSEE